MISVPCAMASLIPLLMSYPVGIVFMANFVDLKLRKKMEGNILIRGLESQKKVLFPSLSLGSSAGLWRFPEPSGWFSAMFHLQVVLLFFPWVGAAAAEVNVAWRDIETKWLEGKPEAFIQIVEVLSYFFSYPLILVQSELACSHQQSDSEWNTGVE